jgi:hypothetical protein
MNQIIVQMLSFRVDQLPAGIAVDWSRVPVAFAKLWLEGLENRAVELK